MVKPIISPVNREVIKSELTEDRFIRQTKYGGNKIFIVNAHNSPHVMQEIGRLREWSFRGAGGGTGEPVDIDAHDTDQTAFYEQLIVWSEAEEEIVGGYRFILCNKAIGADGSVNLSTAHYFNFSDEFINDYLPYTIELGRSWVQPAFQPGVGNRRGLYSLDNLWDGLGALVHLYPEMQYFFGKVTMYPHYNTEARDLLMAFMQHYFPDMKRLVWPIHPLQHAHDMAAFKQMFVGLDYKEGHRVLNQKVRQLGENIPPLINSYMNLSPTMLAFGTCVNPDFGGVEETGILVNIEHIYPEKKSRYVIEEFGKVKED